MDNTPEESLFAQYMTLIRKLRKECPWDKEQTPESLRSHLIEEAYEVVDAISEKNNEHLRNELGDLMLHIALQAVIGEEKDVFTISEILSHSHEKLVRRHPHVFSDTDAPGPEDVERNWETIKRTEGKSSILEGIPKSLPSLILAQRTQEKASAVGFDWKKKSDVWKKVLEEIQEFESAEHSGDYHAIDQEYGDLLFALVNYSRFISIDAEFSLHRSVDKFTNRFARVEAELLRMGKKPEESTLEEMDRLWDDAKRQIP